MGGVLAGAGIVAGVALMISSFVQYNDEIDNMDRINVPGQATVELGSADEYTVYHEYPSASRRSSSRWDVDVQVTAPDGSQIPMDEYSSLGEFAYTSGGRSGVAIYSFDAPEPGTYQFNVSGDGGNIAVGEGPNVLDMAGRVVLGIAVGFVGVVIGLVIVIVVGIKRGNSKRRLRPRTPPPPPPGWGYPPPGAMPPPAPPAAPPPTPSAG